MHPYIFGIMTQNDLHELEDQRKKDVLVKIARMQSKQRNSRARHFLNIVFLFARIPR